MLIMLIFLGSALALFWEEVPLIMINILGNEIPQSYMVLYFGNITGKIVIKADRYLLKTLITAQKAITKRWYNQIHQYLMSG